MTSPSMSGASAGDLASALVIDLVDENRHLAADESFEALRADVFLKLHQLYAPRFANIVRNGPGSSFAAAPSTEVSKCTARSSSPLRETAAASRNLHPSRRESR